jgi:protein-tyrosine phosphatase
MNLLFVCTGNTCRSPLAAALAAREATRLGMTAAITSAGIQAADDAPASEGSIQVAAEIGLDLRSHQAQLLTRPMVLEADTVFVMDERQRAFIHVLAPEAESRVHVLRDYATRGADRLGVADPFGGDITAYRRTRDELEGLVRRSLERLHTEAARGAGRND